MRWSEKFWGYVKRKWWYLVLLIGSSYYVYNFRNDIYELSTLNAKTLIFILWLILLILPLFSEIELLGVKVKKEVEKAKEEVKSSIQSIQTQIMQLQLNSSIANTNNINLNAETLPTE